MTPQQRKDRARAILAGLGLDAQTAAVVEAVIDGWDGQTADTLAQTLATAGQDPQLATSLVDAAPTSGAEDVDVRYDPTAQVGSAAPDQPSPTNPGTKDVGPVVLKPSPAEDELELALDQIIQTYQRAGWIDTRPTLGFNPNTGQPIYGEPIGQDTYQFPDAYAAVRRRGPRIRIDQWDMTSDLVTDSTGSPVVFDRAGNRMQVVYSPDGPPPGAPLAPGEEQTASPGPSPLSPRSPAGAEAQPPVTRSADTGKIAGGSLGPAKAPRPADTASGWWELTGQGWRSFAPDDGYFQVGRSQAPTFYSGREFDDLGGMPPEELAQLQRKLVLSGLLDSSFRAGMMDQATLSAYRGLLAVGNATGATEPEQALAALIANQTQERDNLVAEIRAGARASVLRLEPDTATAKERVDQLFTSLLGRDPTAQQKEAFAAYYLRDSQDANVAEAERQLVSQANAALTQQAGLLGGVDEFLSDAGVAPEGPTPAPFSPVTVSQVDPEARLLQAIRDRFSGEIELNDEQADADVQAGRGRNIGQGLSRLFGGVS